MNEEKKATLASLGEGVMRRFDGAFFTALGIVLMLRTLTYVDTVADIRAGFGVELNPFAQFNIGFVALSDVFFAASVIILAILVRQREVRIVGYSFVIALMSADFTSDMAQFLQLPPINLAIAQVYAVVWGVTAIIPLVVGVWQIEGMAARKAREERPLEGGRLRDLELTI